MRAGYVYLARENLNVTECSASTTARVVNVTFTLLSEECRGG